MNEGPDFSHPDDDAPDPLLRALRERLGESFGQDPPPALWAGIRQQLPAPPRAWWLRRRRLLPLLALLLAGLIGSVAVWQVRRLAPATRPLATHTPLPPVTTSARQPLHSQPATASDQPVAAARQAATPIPIGTATSPVALRPGAAATNAAGREASGSGPLAASNQPLPALRGSHRQSASTSRPGPTAAEVGVSSHRQPAGLAKVTTSEETSAAAPQPQRLHSGATLIRSLAQAGHTRRPRASAASTAGRITESATTPTAAAPRSRLGSAPSTLATTTKRASRQAARRQSSAAATAELKTTPAELGASSLAGHPYAATKQRATSQHSQADQASVVRRGALAENPLSLMGSAPVALRGRPATRPAPLDSAAGRLAKVPDLAVALPTPLAPRPDSAGPWLPPVRRWSVLVLAGPSFSYRALRTTGGGLAYSPIPSVSSPYSGLTGTSNFSSDLVGLERPTLGMGAQVQARRVLSGRWALAFGAGYQEYAAQLALAVTTHRSYGLSTGNAVYFDSTFSVHHRDTYRLLTLPVQLGYALGAPHGRLALGLLGGLEPSFYLGGRTTEGSSCDCQQQTFTSASGSPYNTWSLGLSLGLDVRYRLGGPTSRWQWVVQPTGRYIATPFVRSNSLYARRQPYSLGLLTGLSWDF